MKSRVSQFSVWQWESSFSLRNWIANHSTMDSARAAAMLSTHGSYPSSIFMESLSKSRSTSPQVAVYYFSETTSHLSRTCLARRIYLSFPSLQDCSRSGLSCRPTLPRSFGLISLLFPHIVHLSFHSFHPIISHPAHRFYQGPTTT